jgi:hypothetical protein
MSALAAASDTRPDDAFANVFGTLAFIVLTIVILVNTLGRVYPEPAEQGGVCPASLGRERMLACAAEWPKYRAELARRNAIMSVALVALPAIATAAVSRVKRPWNPVHFSTALALLGGFGLGGAFLWLMGSRLFPTGIVAVTLLIPLAPLVLTAFNRLRWSVLVLGLVAGMVMYGAFFLAMVAYVIEWG